MAVLVLSVRDCTKHESALGSVMLMSWVWPWGLSITFREHEEGSVPPGHVETLEMELKSAQVSVVMLCTDAMPSSSLAHKVRQSAVVVTPR